MNDQELQALLAKSGGRCHPCAAELDIADYGGPPLKTGGWETDYVLPLSKGGVKTFDNSLPICVSCNRARWDHVGQELRDLLNLGELADKEIRKGSPLGKQLAILRDARLAENKDRRKGD